MSLFTRVPAARWLVPAAAVAVLLGGTSLVRAATTPSASAPAALPPQTSAQLLADIATANVKSLSGTIVQTSNLGIPDLPGLNLGDGSSVTTLLSGTHTLRLWMNGLDQQRVSLLSNLGETDAIHNGRDLWIWSSKDNSASHRTLSANEKSDSAKPSLTSGTTTGAPTPLSLADLALKFLDPGTTVSVAANDVVAGRTAYELQLQPKDAGSLISSVRIAIDGAEHIPLRVQVLATGVTDPAIDIAFSSVDFSQPDASEFSFKPPPGATVTDDSTTSATTGCSSSTPSATTGTETGPSAPKLVGTGWTTVIVGELPASAAATPVPNGCGGGVVSSLGIGSLSRVTMALPAVSGSWGSGHLLTGTVMSVLLTDDGRVVAGAVAPAALYSSLSGR